MKNIQPGMQLYCINDTCSLFERGKKYLLRDTIRQDGSMYYKMQYGRERIETWWIDTRILNECFRSKIELNSNTIIL